MDRSILDRRVEITTLEGERMEGTVFAYDRERDVLALTRQGGEVRILFLRNLHVVNVVSDVKAVKPRKKKAGDKGASSKPSQKKK
jgi:hypothetical protein